jgi:hypothetical protein
MSSMLLARRMRDVSKILFDFFRISFRFLRGLRLDCQNAFL